MNTSTMKNKELTYLTFYIKCKIEDNFLRKCKINNNTLNKNYYQFTTKMGFPSKIYSQTNHKRL